LTWQIRPDFTTQLLHNYNLKLSSKDYSQERARVAYLPSVVVVLRGLEVAERKDLSFYTEDLTAGILDVQERVMSKGWEKTTIFPSLKFY
jgi:hypothetical protein